MLVGLLVGLLVFGLPQFFKTTTTTNNLTFLPQTNVFTSHIGLTGKKR